MQRMLDSVVSSLHSSIKILYSSRHSRPCRFMDGEEVARWFEKDGVAKAKEICDAMIVRICGREYSELVYHFLTLTSAYGKAPTAFQRKSTKFGTPA